MIQISSEKTSTFKIISNTDQEQRNRKVFTQINLLFFVFHNIILISADKWLASVSYRMGRDKVVLYQPNMFSVKRGVSKLFSRSDVVSGQYQ